jgi:hypothetical protein
LYKNVERFVSEFLRAFSIEQRAAFESLFEREAELRDGSSPFHDRRPRLVDFLGGFEDGAASDYPFEK